jgi:hypothetical protein
MLMQLDSNSHRAEESKQAPVESDAAMALSLQQEEILIV